MQKPIKTYVALGSNKGDRLAYLQQAVDAIFEQIGAVFCVSPLYQTPAWGFEGEDFLNACIGVNVYCSAEEMLEELQKIEASHGREHSSNGYADRTLDLDLLFYGQDQIDTPRLTVPHPEIAGRRFVLEPLCDIAGKLEHPVYEKTIEQLLRDTADEDLLRRSEHELRVPQINFDPLNFLAVEGNIGAGKTSLATMISQEFNAKLIVERYKDNPFLPKFYKDQRRYAFPLEMSFLADRYQQWVDDTAQYDLFNDFIVSDYDIYKSMIFAQVTLEGDEKQLYKRLFSIMYKELNRPDLYVYLYQNTARLLQNIKKRGRSYEQDIPADYLNQINEGYLEFVKTQNHLPVIVLDISELDFVNSRVDYLELIREITR